MTLSPARDLGTPPDSGLEPSARTGSDAIAAIAATTAIPNALRATRAFLEVSAVIESSSRATNRPTEPATHRRPQGSNRLRSRRHPVR